MRLDGLWGPQFAIARLTGVAWATFYPHNGVMPTAALRQVRSFDPDIPFSEGWELAFRLQQAGVTYRFVPDARTYHPYHRHEFGDPDAATAEAQLRLHAIRYMVRKQLLKQIPAVADRAQAEARHDPFASRCGDRCPKAVATPKRDWERMVTFFDFPPEHLKHLRTTNPVANPFASVRLRTNAGKRYRRVASATALIWRVLMVAEGRFRKLYAPDLLPSVLAGRIYQDCKSVVVKNQSVRNGVRRAA